MRSHPIVRSLFICIVMTGTQAWAYSEIESIQVADDVPEAQVARLQSDLDYLKTLNFNHPDAELLRLMQIPDANPTTLIDWMSERVHYLVSEDLDLTAALGVARSHYAYENPGIFPEIETPAYQPGNPRDSGARAQVVMVMQNITPAFYYAGKKSNQLARLTIPGVGNIEVTSPRTGVLKIGKGLFSKRFQSDEIKTDMKPYVAMRLSTLFHEARHSDGNGKSLAFLHATCPSGPYQGFAACDRNLNGPYEIETQFLNAFLAACTDCSEGDQRAISVLAADADSRQIKFTPTANTAQNRKIQALKSQMEMCKLFTQLNVTLPPNMSCDLASLQKQRADLEAYAETLTSTPSIDWDASPEGI